MTKQETKVTVRFECTNCESRLKAPSSRLGHVIRCPSCNCGTLVSKAPPARTQDRRQTADVPTAINSRFNVATMILGCYLACSIPVTIAAVVLGGALSSLDSRSRALAILFLFVGITIRGLLCGLVFIGQRWAVGVVGFLSALGFVITFVLAVTTPPGPTSTALVWADVAYVFVALVLSVWTLHCGRKQESTSNGASR